MDANDSLVDCFSLIDDPRAANSAHPLKTVLFSVLVGVLCGADGFVEAEQIAQMKVGFISRFVPVRRRIPTHDTMARLLGLIDPEQFVMALAAFMERVTGHAAKDIINLDGKTLRGVVGTAALKRRVGAAEDQAHIVTAFSTLRRVVLAQVRSSNVANEVQAAQELLEMIEIKGAVVTIDAAHTVYRTLEIIAERGADVVVTVKANASALLKAVEAAFKRRPARVVETAEGSRGKRERRRYEVVPASGAAVDKNFKTLRSFVRVTRTNTSHSGKRNDDTITYYATSLPPHAAERIAECIRARWGIENKVHWVLDIAFAEDRSRVRIKNAPENLARMRHIALNMLRLVRTPLKLSFAMKRKFAAIDDAFLERALRMRKAA